jgi:hypothetical protein
MLAKAGLGDAQEAFQITYSTYTLWDLLKNIEIFLVSVSLTGLDS